MKQANLGVSSSPLQLSGELLLRFLLTTCNETSAPPHPLVSVRMSFSGELLIIFPLTASSRLRLTPQIFFFACSLVFISFLFNTDCVFMGKVSFI